MLSDRNAVRLAELLRDYFVDCSTIDPGGTPPQKLTVDELLDDLASSTDGEEQRTIEALLDETLELYS